MEGTVGHDVKSAFEHAIHRAFPALEEVDPALTMPQAKFGDYQCNAAMSMFKKQREKLGNDVKSPKDVAEKIKAALIEGSDIMFSEVIVAPQGFLSVRFSVDFLSSLIALEFRDNFKPKVRKTLSVLVDYSSPNIAKEMHVGHLRSTIIGESICRLLEFVGHKVLRVNHLGDWGTQFGMLIEYMRDEYPDFQKKPPELSDLTNFYRAAKQRFDEDPSFKLRAQQTVPLLQGGDPFCKAAWTMFCDISRKDFDQIYKRFEVKLIERGESFYNDMIPAVTEELQQLGLVTESDGALCCFVKDDAVPLILRKSDGGYGYDSTDIAGIKHRLKIENHDWVIVTTDMGQETHFAKIYKLAEAAGWHTPPITRCSHVGFGVVQGDDGKKFKTRSGDLVKLTDLLDEAVERARVELENRQTQLQGSDEDVSGDIDKAAEQIGMAAIRYFDLKQNRTTNYRFSYDKMLDPKGNTAVYILYAYARLCAIFRKAGVDPTTLDPADLKLELPAERELAVEMFKLYDVVNACLEDLHIHRVAEYVYNLCGIFTNFYQTCRVVGVPQQNSRLVLCELTRKFLHKALYLLGIKPLERI